MEKVSWSGLSANPGAIQLLLKNMHMIDWFNFALNNPLAPLYIDLILEHGHGYSMLHLLENPLMLDLNGAAMHKQIKPIAEELIAKVLHPNRVRRNMEQYGYNLLEDEYVRDE
jgi:hypothetical protein